MHASMGRWRPLGRESVGAPDQFLAPPGAHAPRVLLGVPPHPIPTSTPRGACPPGSFPAPSHPWEGDDRGVARPLGGVAHHGSPSPTPPMPGHLDVVEGLKPSRANLPLADPRGGVTKSPALLSDVLLLTSFLFSMCFYYCLRILASEHMSESKGAATPNLPSY